MAFTLLMRLAGPMQSWGVSSRFSIRETLTEPSKSGVIGLLCAAVGWDRSEETLLIAGRERSLADLAALRFGVRVVREGVVRRDYHTAQNVLRAKAKLRPDKPTAEGDLQQTVLSERYYLSDAYFLVGLESDDQALLLAFDAALARPYWPLSLGRKAFLPSRPVRFVPTARPGDTASGVVNLPLTEALLTALPDEGLEGTRRLVLDAVRGQEAPAVVEGTRLTLTRRSQRTDEPLSFSPRRFAPRDVLMYATPNRTD